MLIPLRREQLDDMRCGMKHGGRPCDHQQGVPLYFHARCHPEAATRVMYDHGVLHISCHRCEAAIAQVSVKE
ncbi:hypothetical protein [Candidatus Solirubrobacter pratensis]|uniref:hypothetical protein n=1 Tax=Candidatus Solirubrobacter pratensis TaxID=1298857 RepID=UPI00048003FD|nr:hypothetical protein [Candidatus Solirubrobacter pratensis]